MEKDKKKIFSGKSQVKVLGIKNVLTEEGIAFFEIDKTDSSYAQLFGNIEIYVNVLDEERALEVIKTLL
jgi:hypothetical protein